MIHLDPKWGKNKELDAFEALILACIVDGYDKYETIYDLFVKKVAGDQIEAAIDFLVEKDWIALDKKSQDVYTLSEKGRYHYADHAKRPTRQTRSKRPAVAEQPFTPPKPEEVCQYMTELIEACGFGTYAQTWGKVKTKAWFEYYQREDVKWTIKNKASKTGRTPMKDWKASCRLWINTEYNEGDRCKFRLPHPTDPKHPSNQHQMA